MLLLTAHNFGYLFDDFWPLFATTEGGSYDSSFAVFVDQSDDSYAELNLTKLCVLNRLCPSLSRSISLLSVSISLTALHGESRHDSFSPPTLGITMGK